MFLGLEWIAGTTGYRFGYREDARWCASPPASRSSSLRRLVLAWSYARPATEGSREVRRIGVSETRERPLQRHLSLDPVPDERAHVWTKRFVGQVTPEAVDRSYEFMTEADYERLMEPK